MWAATTSPCEWPATAAGSTPQATPQPRQRDRGGEEDAGEPTSGAPAAAPRRTAQDVLHRPVEMGRERLVALAASGGEEGRGVEQLDGHPRPLRAVAGEEEGGTRGRRRGAAAADALGASTRLRPRQPSRSSSCSRPARQATAARCSKPGRAGRQRVGDVERVELGVGLELRGEAAGGLAQGAGPIWPRARRGRAGQRAGRVRRGRLDRGLPLAAGGSAPPRG